MSQKRWEENDEHKTANKLQKIETAVESKSKSRVFLHRLDLKIIEAPDDHTVFLDLDDAFDGYALAFYCERTSKITILIANNETHTVSQKLGVSANKSKQIHR